MKWLGEQGERAVDVVERASAVSAPVDLQIAAKQLDCGWRKKIYAAYFLRTMKPKVAGEDSDPWPGLRPACHTNLSDIP